MPRSGGESDKLGNRYEGVWTVDSVLDLLASVIRSVQVEPFGDDARGIEFVRTLAAGDRDFHSVKRQRTGGEWTLAALCHQDKSSGRSILGDLFAKQQNDPAALTSFVSSTGANDLRELSERAQRSDAMRTFEQHLQESHALSADFTKYVVPVAGTRDAAFEMLRRLDVRIVSENELVRRVEQRISLMLYRPDGSDADAEAVRVLISEFINDRLGQVIQAGTAWEFLGHHGYRCRDWTIDTAVHERVSQINTSYIRHVEADLINGQRIVRGEATTAADLLTTPTGPSQVVITGLAGDGKSCVSAQTAALLGTRNIPFLALRLDSFPEAVPTTQALGQALGLPASPVVTLAGLANGGPCVQLIDQLDAVSLVSGRNPQLWDTFDLLVQEASNYPNMRVLLVCRTFDLDHDHRLRRLKRSSQTVALGPLAPRDVECALADVGVDPRTLTPRGIELLQTPLHLNVFLQGDPASHGSFESVQDLYHRYWEHKQQLVRQRLGRNVSWTRVIDGLVEYLSERQTLAAPLDILDPVVSDAEAMTSEHVLVREHDAYRFFHEGFFDYAFARRFVQRGGNIIKLLTSSEQHLFRRAQVRQVLAFQRGRDRTAYLTDLANVLSNDGVRFHIKKVALEWVGRLGDPMPEEWQVLEPFHSDDRYRTHVAQAIKSRIPWFDLLDDLGLWELWLANVNAAIIDHALWLLLTDEISRPRSARIAQLLQPYATAGGDWPTRLRKFMNYIEVHHSREMFDLYLTFIDTGVLDDAS